MTNLLDARPTGPAAPLPPPGSPGAPPRRSGPAVRFLWKLLAAVFVVALLVWTPFNVISLLAHEVHDETQSFPAAGLDTLVVDVASGSVTITAAATDEVGVTATISNGLRKTGHARTVTGSTLRLSGTCPAFGGDWCSVDYDVTVPADLAVVVVAGNGGVAIAGTTGAVDVRASNGSVTLTGLAGDVQARTSNGNVRATGLTSRVVTTRASNGRTTLELAAAPTSVTANGSDGSITIVVPADGEPYRVEASTSDGSRDVTVPTDPSAERSITARTSNGNLTIRPATG